jgi:hypothetical protein
VAPLFWLCALARYNGLSTGKNARATEPINLEFFRNLLRLGEKRRLQMKRSRCGFLAFTLLVVLVTASLASTKEPRPLSANGKPLIFQVKKFSVTRQPQSTEQMQLFITSAGMAQAASTGTVTAPLGQNYSYTPIPLGPSESFVIVTVNVSNVRRQLAFSPGDLQLIDGKGAHHESLGFQSFTKLNAWSGFSVILDRKTPNDSTWIFRVPTDAVTGASLQFQNATYALAPAHP